MLAGNEICDKFAIAGFNANMISYLTSQLHLPLVAASNTLTNFGGTSSLTTIIGALIADSFAGRFWTITVGSLFYQLVHIQHKLPQKVPLSVFTSTPQFNLVLQIYRGWSLSQFQQSSLRCVHHHVRHLQIANRHRQCSCSSSTFPSS